MALGMKKTSVEVDETSLELFKIKCIETKFSLHKLVSRSIYLFLNDKEYREMIINHKDVL